VKKSLLSILLIVALFTFSGCKTITHVTSNPPGAAISVDNMYEGVTPMDVTIENKFGPFVQWELRVEKQGYITEKRLLSRGPVHGADLDIPPKIHVILTPRETIESRLTTNHSNDLTAKTHSIAKSGSASIKHDLSVMNQWAVIIGLSKYQHSGNTGLTNLIFADDDAKAFALALQNLGWSDSHIKSLINEEATQRNILIALESWLTKAGPNDQIVLFWAGHGFPDPEDPEKVYFACYDTDIKIPATGYRMDKVRAALEERRTKNVVVLADTCHAGKLITRGDRGVSIVPNIEKMRREQNIPKGWIFMVGADTDRQAVEHSSWSNGAFTHSLIKGLGGGADGYESAGPKDGTVTMGELKAYMNTAMPDETQKVLGVAKRPVITTSTGDPDIWNLTIQAK